MRQLEFFQRRVRQGIQVEDCQDFARFIRMSGICTLMENQPCQGEDDNHTARLRELFPYDGKQLYYEARQLEMACCEYWAGRTRDSEGTAKGASLGDLESIERKLDLMAGRLAQLESVKPAAKRRVKLKVIDKKGVAA
ncbi:MAG TPA: hypothetical protein VGO67_21440 [Verrucomicrobiae bacterium]